jgi:superfamily II DNA/RNA helicase
MSIDPLKLTDAIRKSYNRYLTTTFRLRDQNLQDLFYKAVEEYKFTNGPILEATPPFKKGCSVGDLREQNIVDRSFEEFLYHTLPYLERNTLYLHQDRAIRKVLSGRNVVIASGTGSGKTESFLIPILHHLFKEHKEGKLSPGVRALLLYPMNALANDQLRRLEEIATLTEKYAPEFSFTFGRYVGDTKKTKVEAENKFRLANPDKEPVKNELLSRKEMQDTPPHILITNYAMLEYLLLRPDDSPFFDGQHANHWKYLVLDEAHIYNGASGIEMGMLVRRLKDRICDGKEGVIQCIATSATLGNDEKDFFKVKEFASNLFGEKFDWNRDDENRQDIIKGEREQNLTGSESLIVPLALYKDLESLIKHSEPNQLLQTLYDICKQYGVPLELIKIAKEEANGSAKDFLYKVLINDNRIAKLRQFLERDESKADDYGPKDLDDCINHLMNNDNKTEENVQAVLDLINVSVWARQKENELSLLPARYHLFVRAPEGIFVSLYPEKKQKIFLERRELSDDGFAVFDLASCRRCGQEYLVGDIVEGKLRHPFAKIDTRRKNRYFLLWNEKSGIEEDEDEGIAVPEELAQKGKVLGLCTKCGTVYENTDVCKCSDDTNTIKTIIEVIPKAETLNICYRCGLRSINIVREFVFQHDAPTAVLATALFENLEKRDPKEKKILAFSDSRQDAAFFAPYLDYTYSRFLNRRLIIEVLKRNQHLVDFGLQDLCDNFIKIAEERNLFDSGLRGGEKRKEAWGCIIQEFCALDRRICLEGVGLLSFKVIPPTGWNPPSELLNDPWNLSKEECFSLFQILLDTLRYNKAITFPADAPSPTDEIFSRFNRNKEYRFKGEGSDANNGIYSFISSNGRTNSRLQIILKLYKKITGKELSTAQSSELLNAIWNDFRTNWVGKQIFQYSDKELGILFQLDYRYWQIIQPNSELPWLICNTCGFISWTNVRGICPTFGCNGELQPMGSPVWKRYLEKNHYRYTYTHLLLSKLTAEEHTAQLKPDEASSIQQKFINGEVNVLSCSTTFELGVDLGELETIFLRNVPPEPANYIQRAGRAGRRLDSIGFILTFAQLRSHDLTYFKEPKRMVEGRIAPPSVEIRNEKIVRRHLHSIVMARFLRQFPDYFGNVNSFFRLDGSGVSGLEMIRKFLDERPTAILESLKRTIPESLHTSFGLTNWDWLKDFIENGGSLEIADAKIRDEYLDLEEFYQRKESDWINTKEQSKRNKLNLDMNWSKDRLETIKKKPLLDFLAGNTVIPKYGFPVDVVELAIYSHLPVAKKIQLERDLRIALSEFAPSSKVVAKGYLWESAGLRVIKNRAWDVYWYAICPQCSRFNIQKGTIEEKPPTLPCGNCESSIARTEIRRFITPIFGFVTSREADVKKPGESRPKKEFSTRPYFFNYRQPLEKYFQIGNFGIRCKYSSDGELAVVCKGKKGVGFYVCFDCGRSFAERQRTNHKKPNGEGCSSSLRGPLHFGHKYKTDVLSILFENFQFSDLPMDDGFWYSLLYALLEGTSAALGIRRQDLDGCLYPENNKTALILFDNVPGGAGHVKRLMEETNLHEVLKSAYSRMKNCMGCGPETSCYGCLRNYQNQFCHEKLKRGIIRDFFLKNLEGTSEQIIPNKLPN